MTQLNLKDQVTLSPNSLYARSVFQKEGKGHLSTKVSGTVTKVLTDLLEGWCQVKFKDGTTEKSNVYLEGMLVKVGTKVPV